MKRREFITLLGGTAVAWPLAARAQQPTLPVIGFLSSETPSGYAFRAAAFRQGLSEAGYVESRNVAIEYRWAEGHYDRLPALAADLVRRQVAVIAAAGTQSALAAKAATTTIPIVFSTAADPVAEGLVASLARPGGNASGVNNLATELVQKQIEKLHQMVPAATAIAALVNPTNPTLAEPATKEVQAAGRTLGLKMIHIIQASTERDIDAAFATLFRTRGGRASRLSRYVLHQQARSNRRARDTPCDPRHLSPSRAPCGRRSDELRPQRHRWLSPGWHLRRPHSQG